MKFWQKNFENWRFWKSQFFWVRHFEFFFFKKYCFCFIPMKIVKSLLVSKDGSKFWSSQTCQTSWWRVYLVLAYSDYSIIRIFNVIFSSGQKALLSQVINRRWQGWWKLQGVGTFLWQVWCFNIMNFLVLCFGCFLTASVIFFFCFETNAQL